jgi:hypothetical protein
LAAELGIARGTVVTAFQMLAGEGYTSSAGARGTVVNVALPRVRKLRPTAELVETGEHHRTVRTPPTPLLFQVGLPALDVFPRKLWTQIVVRVARQLDHERMVNPNLHCGMGYEPLRLAIASYLRIARDITCSADQILITAGFQGALGLIIQALLKPGVKVWVEDPGYVSARNLLQQAQLGLVGVRIDDGGLDVTAAVRSAPDARLALVTPSHQYPLGMTLPSSAGLPCSTGLIASRPGLSRMITTVSSITVVFLHLRSRAWIVGAAFFTSGPLARSSFPDCALDILSCPARSPNVLRVSRAQPFPLLQSWFRNQWSSLCRRVISRAT